MGLDSITDLNDFNNLLNNSVSGGYNKAIKTSFWGSRDFILKNPTDGKSFDVKMKDIIHTFARLAETDSDKHLIGDIHDKIFELNRKGENRLKKQHGQSAVFLRDVKTLFSFSNFHSANNDIIENKYLFSKNIKKAANEITQEFDEPLTFKSEFSKKLIKDIFAESKDNPAESENTKNALRYIAHHNPEKALEILEHLKTNLIGMAQHPVNPKKSIESIQHFVEVLEKEIYSAKKELRAVSNQGFGISETIFNLPPASISESDPVANIKAQFGDNVSIILDEKTKKPMVQFKFEYGRDRIDKHNSSIIEALERASEFSVYETPDFFDLFPEGDLNRSVEDGKFTQTLSTDATMLLSGVDGDHFLEYMYQAALNQNNTPEVLEGVIKNLTDSEIKDFFFENDINPSDKLFAKFEDKELLEKKKTLLDKLRNDYNFCQILKNYESKDIDDPVWQYLRNSKIPNEEKSKFFAKYASKDALVLFSNFYPKINLEFSRLESYQASWNKNLKENKRSKILDDVIKNLSDENVIKFFLKNLEPENFNNTKLSEKITEELIKDIRWKVKYESTDTTLVLYLNNKEIPLQKRILPFIRYGDENAIRILLGCIDLSDGIDNLMLDVDPSNPNMKASLLGLAMIYNNTTAFKILYKAGARNCEIQDGEKSTHYDTEKYLKDGNKIKTDIALKSMDYLKTADTPDVNLEKATPFSNNSWSKLENIANKVSINYRIVMHEKDKPYLEFIYDSAEEREQKQADISQLINLKSGRNIYDKEKFVLSLSYEESLALMGYQDNEAADIANFQYEMQKEFYKTEPSAYKNLCDKIEASIGKQDPIATNYTTTTPLEEQIKAHETSKKEGFALLNQIGATSEVISPSHYLIPNTLSSPKLDEIKIKDALNPAIFSWDVTKGVQGDIINDGKRTNDHVVIYGVASQFNGCESPGRYTPKPGQAVDTYKNDKTQGPQAQLAFGNTQVEIINSMANSGFNGLVNVLTETTKGAVQHGYLTPVKANIDAVIACFTDNSKRSKIEYLCVANNPQEGSKPVHQILVSAPAFGQYSIDPNLDKKKIAELQFQCALNGFRAQFIQAAKLSQNGTVPVVLKAVAVGLGAFANDPEIVAKAFYQAAQEFELPLLNNKVQVRLQVYEGPSTPENDPAHRMKDLLFPQ